MVELAPSPNVQLYVNGARPPVLEPVKATTSGASPTLGEADGVAVSPGVTDIETVAAEVLALASRAVKRAM